MTNDTTTMRYDEAIEELDAIVAALQRDDVGVDELAAKVARGAALVEVCRNRLRHAELAVADVVAALREPDGDAGGGRDASGGGSGASVGGSGTGG